MNEKNSRLWDKNTQKHFDELHDYDQRMDPYYLQRRLNELKKILEEYDKHIEILDIGCGTGEFIQYANKLGYLNTYGIDISLTLVNIAKDKGIEKIAVADACNIPFKDNEFDFIILADVIEHIPNYGDCLMEAHRVLKKGGRAFIVYPNPNIVPLLNFISSIGMKVNTKENKISLDSFKNSISGLFIIEKYKTIILASKLPKVLLKIFEGIEWRLSKNLLNIIGFARVLILRKK